MEVFFPKRNDLARPRWPKEQTIILFTLTRIYSDKWPALVATTCTFSRRSLSKTLTDCVQLCIVQCSKRVCWGLQINKVCCTKWKTPPPSPHHHHWQKHFPQYKIITTTTGLWKLIFENNEDWFFLLEIYFCDYIFSKFIHTFIIIISCPCDFCGCCLQMHICFSLCCALNA